jgi:hypothetical protein
MDMTNGGGGGCIVVCRGELGGEVVDNVGNATEDRRMELLLLLFVASPNEEELSQRDDCDVLEVAGRAESNRIALALSSNTTMVVVVPPFPLVRSLINWPNGLMGVSNLAMVLLRC